jgi:hypothetical protein
MVVPANSVAANQCVLDLNCRTKPLIRKDGTGFNVTLSQIANY